ncbi:DUF499 domain-containing protein [Populibacterium corticicola]|uniref:DUF499 domain-containing protein n=1 Tax=Populibacterium corticicola TaxID=1812826 RepID=A0ABW5XD97_9MICO
MAMNNRDRVGKAFDLLSEGLNDIVDEVMSNAYGTTEWNEAWAVEEAQKHGRAPRPMTKHDVQVQLRALTEQGKLFNDQLSRAQQSFASELRESRNRWAHSEPFSSDDAVRAIDTIERLLEAVGSTDSAQDARKLRIDLQRTVFEDQTRQKVKRSHVSIDQAAGLRPWREVIRPHDDVARGEFTASEFAADLHLVHTGQATSPEYGDPVEFFSRTYLTDGLRDLLSRALRRVSGDGGASPVVNLQTNFGGGKTHSMLALYHLFSGTPTQHFPQELQELIAETGHTELDTRHVKRVALVGTYLKPGSPLIKDDGTEVNTIWGELAWQLGGLEAYRLVEKDDKAGTNPGEALRELLHQHSPALILIDEWVAYARQLVTDKELPAGSFETQFTFAQSLTEIVRSIPGTMLVVSIPASDTGEQGAGNDIEIGGANGQAALERLQNVVRRVADQWRPSSKDESFEIVRRRLFQTPDANGLTAISATARAFVMMYRGDAKSFPSDASDGTNTYEMRIRSSYPLHPELLDRLYEDWSTLERFQRTRGVLKLVSSIVHELWASNDSSPLILPGNVPLDATTVNTDLTQYLEDQWKPIIDSDIDGSGSTAHQIDLARSSLGQRFVTQRIARTIFIGAAPRNKSTRKGLDKQYLWLGTAIPGDALGNFGQAVELLAERSTYFYEEQSHYWFDTQPSVAKAASDYAAQLREDMDQVWNEITRRLAAEERKRGTFDRVHIAAETSADVPDLEETRLVIAHPRTNYRKQDGPDAAAFDWARKVVETKGASQRTHRNSLVFLVADRSELERLEDATRNYLGWKRVQDTSDSLNLSTQQRNQTDNQVGKFNQTVDTRIQDTYAWVLYPEQTDPTKPFTLTSVKVASSGVKTLAERVSQKLENEDQLVKRLGPSMLGMTLTDQLASKWEQDREITVGELWGYFTRYNYMPRLTRREVLENAVEHAFESVLIGNERFAIAAGKTDDGTYLDLTIPPTNSGATFQITNSTLLVEHEHALEQRVVEEKPGEGAGFGTEDDDGGTGDEAPTGTDVGTTCGGSIGQGARTGATGGGQGTPPEPAKPTRYFGTVKIDPQRYARDIGMVAREVVDRLAASGVDLEITLDIQASKPAGFDEHDIRVVTENAANLKFDPSSGFENH